MYQEYEIVVESGCGDRAALLLMGAGFEIYDCVTAFIGDVIDGFMQSDEPFDPQAFLWERGIHCPLAESR